MKSRTSTRQKNRIIICGFGLSSPGTMGGNSKIAIEIARNLQKENEIHIFTEAAKEKTITNNIQNRSNIFIHTIPEYSRNQTIHIFSSTLYYTNFLKKEFMSLGIGRNDIIYSASDYHVDVLPIRLLKKDFTFIWIASFFLFLPTLFENIRNRYGFPKLKYILVRIYQRAMFHVLIRHANAFVITNDSDKNEFPLKLRKKIFPFYGGVNVEQIPDDKIDKTREAVYCSRLHPQKGLLKFLDAWKIVIEKRPNSRLTVIGNGDRKYEERLHSHAKKLGIDKSIEWLGYVNNREKYEIYRSAKVLVHTTVFDNNGMVAAEALCSGLPVVMFDLHTLRDVYTTGCTKVPYGNYHAFAKTVLDHINSPKELSQAEITELRKKWNWNERSAALEKWIETNLTN